MSNTEEKYDQDVKWLHVAAQLHNKPVPTEDQEENFAERVSVMVVDAKMSEQDAREAAFKRVML